MVERTLSVNLNYNDVFASLADETRRNILEIVSSRAMTISQIANHYKLTYGAISKHILVLEQAKLVIKIKRGKERVVSVDAAALSAAEDYLHSYCAEWEKRLDSFELYVINNPEKNKEK
jgi:DNA-binding transcriptional ArsR family regulator